MEGKPKRGGPRRRAQPFRFFDLPSELRLRVYELHFQHPKPIDLDSLNFRMIAPLLSPFLVSHRMHDEAARVFYSINTFRVLPTHGRFFRTKSPLLARLPASYRAHITKVELRLGLGWTGPPSEWAVEDHLGLQDCTRLRLLKVFVHFDPASHPAFEEFQESPDSYTEFSVGLLQDFFARVPSVVEVELDAWSTIQQSSPLLQGVLKEAKKHNKMITWGPQGEWDKRFEIGLVNVLQSLSLSPSRPLTLEPIAPLA